MRSPGTRGLLAGGGKFVHLIAQTVEPGTFYPRTRRCGGGIYASRKWRQLAKI
jgi:hypothetical protein